MGVDHCRFDVLVAEEFLDGTDVVAIFQQVGGKAVAEGMATDALVNAGPLGRFPDRLLQTALVYVVTADGARAWVF